jgi:hypothetical protein
MSFNNLLIVSVATIALIGCSSENKTRDFDMVCSYFGELKATPIWRT